MWTVWPRRQRPPFPEPVGPPPDLDVLIRVFNQLVHVVAPVVAAAGAIRGGVVNVYLLDDAGRPELEDLPSSGGPTTSTGATTSPPRPAT